jgi:hypothetical protein
MTELDHRLEREILIRARAATVFGFFTDSDRFARWWGAGSRIVPEPGGEVTIPHLAAILQFRPGLSLERVGEPRHCQGTLLVDWRLVDAGGQEQGRGTNVVELAPDSRYQRIVGVT